MEREFITLDVFDYFWEHFGLDDEDLKEFQDYILSCPGIGDLVSKTGGLRKIRWKRKGMGKSGGIRIIYLDLPKYKTTFLIFAYSKTKKDDLTDKEKEHLKDLAKVLKNEFKKKE